MSVPISESLAARVVEIGLAWKPEGMAPEAWVASLTPEDVADILAEAVAQEQRLCVELITAASPWARAAMAEVIRRAYVACRETEASR